MAEPCKNPENVSPEIRARDVISQALQKGTGLRIGLADEMADDILRELALIHGGSELYISKSILIAARDKRIRSMWDGKKATRLKLMAAEEISERTFYRIIG